MGGSAGTNGALGICFDHYRAGTTKSTVLKLREMGGSDICSLRAQVSSQCEFSKDTPTPATQKPSGVRTFVFNGRPFQTRYPDVFSSLSYFWDHDSFAILLEIVLDAQPPVTRCTVAPRNHKICVCVKTPRDESACSQHLHTRTRSCTAISSLLCAAYRWTTCSLSPVPK